MKKVLCLILSALLVTGLFAGFAMAGEGGSFDDIDEITLIYSSTRNELGDVVQLDWLNKITEASEGKVQFDVYLSNSLISSTRDIPEALAAGIADVGLLNINNYPGVFPLNNNVFSIPLNGITNTIRVEVMDYMYGKYPELEEEFTAAGLKLLGWNMGSATNLGVKLGKQYEGIEDIKNVKLTSNGDVGTEVLAQAGAVPVAVAYPDIYQSLEKNVISGLLFLTAPVYDTSFYEHIDNWVVFGEDSGIMYTPVAVCMGLDRWNSLPDAVKEVFESTSHQREVDESALQLEYNSKLKEVLEAAGHYYTVLTPEQVEEWRPFTQPSADRILSEMEASHPGFGDMVADLDSFIQSLK